jgi:serine/threonine-protein kinase HipA
VGRSHGRFTIPASGNGGDWIIKIESQAYRHLVENEFVMMEWARASGFDVPECRLESADILDPDLQKFVPDGSNIFVIERYDRSESERIHQEDFAQVASFVPKSKYDYINYEKLAVLISNIVGEGGYYEFIRRLTFIIASGNTDAHLKNWSLIYPDGINAQLSPLYDQVCTVAWNMPRLALNFASLNFIRQIDEAAFSRLAQRAGKNPAQTVRTMQECLEVISGAWTTLEQKRYLPASHYEALDLHWKKVPVLQSYNLTPD